MKNGNRTRHKITHQLTTNVTRRFRSATAAGESSSQSASPFARMAASSNVSSSRSFAARTSLSCSGAADPSTPCCSSPLNMTCTFAMGNAMYPPCGITGRLRYQSTKVCSITSVGAPSDVRYVTVLTAGCFTRRLMVDMDSSLS